MQGHRGKKNLNFDKVDGHWYCFRCQSWGRLEDWTPMVEFSKHSTELHVFQPPESWVELGKYSSVTTFAAREYALKKRKLKSEHIAAAKLGIITDRERPPKGEQDWRNRLIVPIISPENLWLGYVGRDISGKSNLPYMYIKGMDRGKLLYNQQAIFEKTEEPLLIVEGTLDAVYLWPNAVALLGMWTDHQIDLIAETKRPVVTVLDGDAWKKGEGLAEILSLHGLRTGSIRLPATDDPDDMDRAWIRDEAYRAL